MPAHGEGRGTGASAKLNTFDVTSLVVGSIIGADVYIATAIGARLVGPSSLLAWILAGAMAMVIALSFSYCVMILPKVGGPYAYVKDVAGPFPGFLVGWSLLLAEWFSLAVFPVAFSQYFVALDPGIDALGRVLLKGLFIIIILVTNLVGIKAAGRVNDVLTIAKLSPLVLIVLGGLVFVTLQPGRFVSNSLPFFTGDLAAFGQALVLIFWAYAGFELSTLPTDEVIEPRKTIPKAIVTGMMIVIGFYFLTNFVDIGSVGASLLGGLSDLINSAVFLLAFVYFATCLATIFLERRHPRISRELRGKIAIPVTGMIFSIVLMGLVSPRLIGISLILLAIGIPVYTFFSPQKELVELKDAFLSADAISRRAYLQGQRFLAYPLQLIKRLRRRRSAT